MNPQYKHTQVGYTTLVCLAIGLAVALSLVGPPQGRPTVIAVAVVLVVCAVLFGTLTVEIGDGRLVWSFGPGLIRNSALVQDIRSVECVRTNWWEGWGIHGTRRGWLYNVSGFDAVLITLEQGKSFMLGTDEPEVLAEALRRTMAGGSA